MFIFDNSLIFLTPDGCVDVFSLWGVLLFLGILGVIGWAVFKIKAFLNVDDESRSPKKKASSGRWQYCFLGISVGLVLLGGGFLLYERDETAEKSYVEAIRYMWWFRLFHKYSAACARGQVLEPDDTVYKYWCKFEVDGFSRYEIEKMFSVKESYANEQKFASFRANRAANSKLVTWFDCYRRYMLSCMIGSLDRSNRTSEDPDYALWVEYNTTVLSEEELERLLRSYSCKIEYNFYRPQRDIDPQR